MPAATPAGFIYPLDSDPHNVAGDIQALAESFDTWVTEEAATRDYIDDAVAGLITVPIGTMMMHGGTTSPTDFLFCRGQALSRVTYAVLFGVLSTRFGVGDGSTTFNLPDMRARSPIGFNDGATIAPPLTTTMWAAGVGEQFGTPVPALPSHNHNMDHGHSGDDTFPVGDPQHIHQYPARLDPISGSLGALGVSNAGGTIVTRDTNPSAIPHHHDLVVYNHSGNTGLQSAGSATQGNYPPGLSVNFIIRVQ
jgi:microcystin-dependent protein